MVKTATVKDVPINNGALLNIHRHRENFWHVWTFTGPEDRWPQGKSKFYWPSKTFTGPHFLQHLEYPQRGSLQDFSLPDRRTGTTIVFTSGGLRTGGFYRCVHTGLLNQWLGKWYTSHYLLPCLVVPLISARVPDIGKLLDLYRTGGRVTTWKIQVLRVLQNFYGTSFFFNITVPIEGGSLQDFFTGQKDRHKNVFHWSSTVFTGWGSRIGGYPNVWSSPNFHSREFQPIVRPSHRVGQSREIYSNSVPLSPPHWPYPKRIRPPSWPRVAVASSNQNTKLFTWRTWPGAGAVLKCDWAARSQCGSKQRRADHTKYIWYVATHGQSVITTELMIA